MENTYLIMVLITKENKTYNYPINLQPTDPSEYTLEVYSHMSKTTTTFTGLTGVVVDDFVGIEMTDVMLSKLPNGEYDYTVYDNDQTRVSIGLLRVDLEQQGTEDDPEYVVYHDEMDGYITAQNQEEVFNLGYESGYTDCYPIAYDDGYDVGFVDGVDSVPLVATGFTQNGVFLAEEGGYNQVSVNVPDNGNYFYFEAISTGATFEIRRNNDAPELSLEYSFNKVNWTGYTYQTIIQVNNGDRVYFRGDNPNGWFKSGSSYNNNTFVTTGKFNIGGDIRSLIDKSMTITALTATECFRKVFAGNSIVNVEKGLLSGIETLSKGCYMELFAGCASLLNSPDLPATNLASQCYFNMFDRCTSLVSAPKVLPATNLASQCYSYMFRHCTSLTTAPELPSYTGNISNYVAMFQDCTSLNYIKCLTKNAIRIDDWVSGVPSEGVFVKDINATGWTMDSPNGIPSGWTVLNDNVLLQSTAITTNGTYVPQSGAAFDNVVVNVPTGITPTGEIAISGNGTYNVTQYVSASVHVPTGITPTGQIAISGNGTYDVTQYASANVNVEYIPDWGAYTPPIFSGSTHLENRPFGFYLENVPANYTLSFKISANYGQYNYVTVYWGDGTYDDWYFISENYVTAYPEHTYTTAFSGWVMIENPTARELRWDDGANPWGNIFDYCKAMYVDNSEYGKRNGGEFKIGVGGGQPISISNSVTHFYAYDPLELVPAWDRTYEYTNVLNFLYRGLVKAQVDDYGYQRYANDIPLKHIYYRCS